MHSILTETTPKILASRASYVAAHRPYFDYLHHLLDTATLPASDVPLPNLTTIAAMVAELRAMHPAAPWLNGVVLGRLLHRVLPSPLLTWHGSRHSDTQMWVPVPILRETTTYRFPMVQRCRCAFIEFVDGEISWSNSPDQWQCASRSEEW